MINAHSISPKKNANDMVFLEKKNKKYTQITTKVKTA